MYKTKIFGGVDSSTNPYKGTEGINKWLEKNPNITIISANTIANDPGGWGYIILYTEHGILNEDQNLE